MSHGRNWLTKIFTIQFFIDTDHPLSQPNPFNPRNSRLQAGGEKGYISYMSARLPDWLVPQLDSTCLPPWLASTRTPGLPAWLSGSPSAPSKLLPRNNPPEGKALLFQQYEMALPYILDQMCGGETFTDAVSCFHIAIDRGAFMRWIKKDPQRYALFKEAKEVRTEVWAGEMIKHAKGIDTTEEIERSKFIVDTYKFFMKSDNKKEYGDTKTIDVNQTISITAAMQAAQTRVERVIDVDVIDEPEYKQLMQADWSEVEDDED